MCNSVCEGVEGGRTLHMGRASVELSGWRLGAGQRRGFEGARCGTQHPGAAEGTAVGRWGIRNTSTSRSDAEQHLHEVTLLVVPLSLRVVPLSLRVAEVMLVVWWHVRSSRLLAPALNKISIK